MDLGISGKVAMVAAASKGIGFAVAEALLAEGCRLSICSRTEQSLGEACARLGSARGYVCDVSIGTDLERWYAATRDEIGSPDILVTNTGGPPAGPLSEVSDELWESGFQSTLLNVVRLTRLASPRMREAGWGRIVHLTSLVAREPSPILPISSTLRSGIGALTRLQSSELAPFGVTVNAVLPGHTLTDRQRHLAELRAEREGITRDEALAATGSSTPVGRLGRPEEIAAAVTFLCSRQASYITGVGLLVDGGLTRSPG